MHGEITYCWCLVVKSWHPSSLHEIPSNLHWIPLKPYEIPWKSLKRPWKSHLHHMQVVPAAQRRHLCLWPLGGCQLHARRLPREGAVVTWEKWWRKGERNELRVFVMVTMKCVFWCEHVLFFFQWWSSTKFVILGVLKPFHTYCMKEQTIPWYPSWAMNVGMRMTW